MRVSQERGTNVKKKAYRSEKLVTEENQKQRLDYWRKIQEISQERLIFIDETAFWVGMSRDIARSEKGKKALCLRQFYKGRKMTLIGAINLEGIVATKSIEESMRKKEFKDFIEFDLVPNLKEGDVIVMDNLSIHKMEGIENLIIGAGARIQYLPTYSPDFNPIEMRPFKREVQHPVTFTKKTHRDSLMFTTTIRQPHELHTSYISRAI